MRLLYNLCCATLIGLFLAAVCTHIGLDALRAAKGSKR
jgi:hypothetical protein